MFSIASNFSDVLNFSKYNFILIEFLAKKKPDDKVASHHQATWGG